MGLNPPTNRQAGLRGGDDLDAINPMCQITEFVPPLQNILKILIAS